ARAAPRPVGGRGGPAHGDGQGGREPRGGAAGGGRTGRAGDGPGASPALGAAPHGRRAGDLCRGRPARTGVRAAPVRPPGAAGARSAVPPARPAGFPRHRSLGARSRPGPVGPVPAATKATAPPKGKRRPWGRRSPFNPPAGSALLALDVHARRGRLGKL